MVLYSSLDRLLPRSYLAKVMAVAIVFGQLPLVALLVVKVLDGLPPTLGWPALGLSLFVSLAGLALSVRAVLRPVTRLEEALAAYEAGEEGVSPLPDGHRDAVGRLMRHANSLIRTTETKIDAAKKLADCDPLTGLLNRRGLERSLGARHGGGAGGAILMMDADHFKRVNDEHGHDVGDRVLRDLGLLLRRHLRQQDLAARFGGEEFVVYLSGLGRARALQVAERVRMSVEDTVRVGNQSQTVSIGIAVWSEADSLSSALKRADDAVYAAKAGGRNRAVLARGGTGDRHVTGLSTAVHAAGAAVTTSVHPTSAKPPEPIAPIA